MTWSPDSTGNGSRTIAITGSASGIGAAVGARLGSYGHRVVGVDLRDAEIIADLSTPDGRAAAVRGVTDACDSVLDGLVTCAGLGGLPNRPGSLVAEVNYFATVELLEGLRSVLVAGSTPSAVAIASNSSTIQPGIPVDVVDACLAGDRDRARACADGAGSVKTYPASKVAVSRWVRRCATTEAWIGAGIRLNAVSPGMIETALVQEQRRDPEMAPLLEMFPIPAGRPGAPEEIAALVEFLLGSESSFFCGSIVVCDGGSEALLRPDDWPTPWDLPLG